jgi:hypothetical protein
MPASHQQPQPLHMWGRSGSQDRHDHLTGAFNRVTFVMEFRWVFLESVPNF